MLGVPQATHSWARTESLPPRNRRVPEVGSHLCVRQWRAAHSHLGWTSQAQWGWGGSRLQQVLIRVTLKPAQPASALCELRNSTLYANQKALLSCPPFGLPSNDKSQHLSQASRSQRAVVLTWVAGGFTTIFFESNFRTQSVQWYRFIYSCPTQLIFMEGQISDQLHSKCWKAHQPCTCSTEISQVSTLDSY